MNGRRMHLFLAPSVVTKSLAAVVALVAGLGIAWLWLHPDRIDARVTLTLVVAIPALAALVGLPSWLVIALVAGPRIVVASPLDATALGPLPFALSGFLAGAVLRVLVRRHEEPDAIAAYDALGRKLLSRGVYTIVFTPAAVIAVFWLVPTALPSLAPTINKWATLPWGLVTAVYIGWALGIGTGLVTVGALVTCIQFRNPRRSP
ncbi:MAG: hypothetical protein HY049_10485 [Acidobacteria bacterium]|nr:hypothetical protein [Acidobacteriota bacterium]